MLKKIVIVILVCIAIGVLAYPKVEPIFSNNSDTNTETEQNDTPLLVDVFIVQESELENKIFTTGSIISNEEVELSSEIAGKIEKIYFNEGETVKKNQLLIKINDSELQAQLQRVQHQLELARTQVQRQKQLLEKGGISQAAYDVSYNEMKVLEAEKQLIVAQIEKTEIRAPFEGRIGLKYVSDGSYIDPSTRIASLQDIDPVKIDFSIPERYSSSVDIGDDITFTVQGSDKVFKASIYALEPKINMDTRNLQIRARSPNPNTILLPGAFADMELVLENIEDALMIPTIALIPEIDGNKVYVYRNGLVKEKRVKTGIRRQKYIQLRDGLSQGDTVLTSGLLQVKPNMNVNIRNVNSEIQMSLR